ERQHVGREEQHGNQRDAAPEFDENDADRADDGEFRAPPECEQNAQRQREDDAGERDHERDEKPTPEAGLYVRGGEHPPPEQKESGDRKKAQKQKRGQTPGRDPPREEKDDEKHARPRGEG